MSKKTLSDRERADYQKAKFNQSMLERLDSLKQKILEQVSGERKGIREDDRREAKEITTIMGTAANPDYNDLLVECKSDLDYALEPLFPYEFADDLFISFAFQQYRDAFVLAIGKNAQVWEKVMLDGAKAMYYSRIEDKLDKMDTDVKDMKKSI